MSPRCAICFDDRIEEATTKIRAENPTVYKDFEKLLASPDIDAVIIATPPFEHPRMLAAAVQSKKHIYCEKPMGVDFKGVQTSMKASRQQDPKKNLFVGFQQRYGSEYIEGYRRLTAGDIGELVNARAFWISGDPFTRRPYDDPKIEKLRNWFCYRDLSGDFIVEQDCHNFDVLHWYLNARPISAVGMGGRKVRTNMEILDHLTLSFEFPNNIHVNFEANQLSPRGFSRVGEEFTGTKGVLQTSRQRLVHIKGPKDEETVEPKHRDITQEAFETFLENIVTGKVENIGERSSISTLFAVATRRRAATTASCSPPTQTPTEATSTRASSRCSWTSTGHSVKAGMVYVTLPPLFVVKDGTPAGVLPGRVRARRRRGADEGHLQTQG